jgi:heme-degrading monooxygenase HmoA
MFARVNIFERQAVAMGEGISVLRGELFSVMQKQKGFKNLYLLGNADKNKGYLITLWESEADLQAWLSSEEMAQAVARLQKALPEGSSPPPFEDYQVVYQA